VRKADNLPQSCAVVTKSGNPLGLSGPVTGLLKLLLKKNTHQILKFHCLSGCGTRENKNMFVHVYVIVYESEGGLSSL